MQTFTAMLRGINVGPAKRMAMPALKTMFETLGYSNVKTYVQSGNVVFDSPETNFQAAAERIEGGIEETFGYQLPVFVRVAADFRRLTKTNPFTTARQEDPAKLHVTFLYNPPSADLLGRLAAPAGITDEFLASPGEIFLFCPNGYGRTKLTNNYFENKLKVPATTRNWNTVLALLELASESRRD